jgi:CubicO group peptidase (beta-lactamase class C family)
MSRVTAFSRSRLLRMSSAMRGFVERGEAAGVLTLVCRHDEVHVEAAGVQDLDTRVPLRRDTLFRVASLTKPVTAVAAMMLVEEAKLRLDDPVERWLPELSGQRVLRALDAEIDDTMPVQRAVSVRDLLTFRLGFGMLLGAPETTLPIQRATNAAHIDAGPESPSLPPDVWIKRLGELPLMHQPGERWMYHTGADVLSVLIARVANMSFEEFLQTRIFGPLGMHDTMFQVPSTKLDRLATPYQLDASSGKLVRYIERRGPSYPFGATGLVSTADDFLAFGRMLLNRGRHGGRRLLARPTVEAMTTDQLTLEQKIASPFFPGYWGSHGWGLGMAVVTQRDGIASVPGRFGWDGAFGTSWYSDPHENMVTILMTQRYANPLAAQINADFSTLAYQAIDD